MLAGSPPPVKPYGKRHPVATTSASTLMIDMPDRRIEFLDSKDSREVQLERSPDHLLVVLDTIRVGAIHPLDDPPPFDMLESNEGVTAEGDPPRDRMTEVGPEQVPVSSNR